VIHEIHTKEVHIKGIRAKQVDDTSNGEIRVTKSHDEYKRDNLNRVREDTAPLSLHVTRYCLGPSEASYRLLPASAECTVKLHDRLKLLQPEFGEGELPSEKIPLGVEDLKVTI
jgi:hypothetical protein